MGLPLRVLLAEDSEDDAELLVFELERGGYEPIYQRVDTPSAMSEALNRESWDVIICDYSMPAFNAPAALSLMQAKHLDLPFIIVSGTIGEEIAVAAMKAGAHDYLIKDKLARLVPAIERELREASERQQRRQAQQALRESEERFRYLIENASDVITILDAEGTIQYESPAVERVLGYDPHSLIGQKLFTYLEPESISAAQHALTQAVQNPGAAIVTELFFRHQDGSRRIFESISNYLTTSANTTSVMVASRDITERAQAEATEKALAKEKELSELRASFFSMMSHELRNPLMVIRGAVQLLEQFNQQLTEEKKREYFQRMRVAIKRMQHLLDDVLTISRAEAGKFMFNPVLLDLPSFCRDLVEEFELTLSDRHQLIFHSCASSLSAWIDPEILRHILSNLLSNAIKYSPQGGVIELTLRCECEKIIFQIVDHGIGIKPEDQQRLFQPFYRAGNVSRIPGTGLGLAIVNKFVELHGGTIEMMSEVGKGTSFAIALPLMDKSLIPDYSQGDED